MKLTQKGGIVGLPDNVALLVTGQLSSRNLTMVAEDLSSLGRLLMSSFSQWQVHRRPTVSGQHRQHSIDALDVLRTLDVLGQRTLDRLFVVLVGQIVNANQKLAFTFDPTWEDHPEFTTIPLEDIGSRLQQCRARACGVVILATLPDSVTVADVAGLVKPDPDSASFVVVSEWSAEGPRRTLRQLSDVLTGDVGDGRRLGVSVGLVSEYLSVNLPKTVSMCGNERSFIWNVPPSGLDALAHGRLSPAPISTGYPPLEPQDLTGRTLRGNVILDGILGKGGFGTVYHGSQVDLGNRPVAVKVLHDQLAEDDDARRMFAQEMVSLAGIDSPNVVRIYYTDLTDGGRYYFVMERLHGKNLREFLQTESPLTHDQVGQIAHGVLSGLAAIHDRGIVHRDIKPENIMICPAAGGNPMRVVLYDFGIARRRGEDRSTGTETTEPGTPAYMAPEQFQKPPKADQRTDVFQVGMVLLEMLTQWQRPDNTQDIPPVDELLKGVDFWPEFLRACLDPNPDLRFANAFDCKIALNVGRIELGVAPSSRGQARLLDAYSQVDRYRFYGREGDAARLTDAILYNPLVVLSAPSGMGKSSLFLAAVIPNLKSLRRDVVYVTCRSDFRRTLIHRLTTDPIWGVPLAAGISPSSPDALKSAITNVLSRRRRGMVVVLDQAETVVGDDDGVIAELVELCRQPDFGLSVVIGIRDDAMGGLLQYPSLGPGGYEVFQLGLLSSEATRQVLKAAFSDYGEFLSPSVQEALVDALLTDGAEIAKKHRWKVAAGVYPPHLQIAVAAVLERARARGRQDLTLLLQEKSFPLAVLLESHVRSVLRQQLNRDEFAVCGALFAELTVDFERRRARTIDELVVAVGRDQNVDIRSIINTLVRARVLLPTVNDNGDRCVEITHDSLLGTLKQWVDTIDLDRRRAKETLRYHLSRIDKGLGSFLTRPELREIKQVPLAVRELDQERMALGSSVDAAHQLVITSERMLQRQRVMRITIGIVLVGIALVVYLNFRANENRRIGNIGNFVLDLRLLDSTDGNNVDVVSADTFPDLWVSIHEPGTRDWFGPGRKRTVDDRVTIRREGALVYHVEARGGPADVVVGGRHRRGETPCAPAIVRGVTLPGYADGRDEPPSLKLVIPTCAATELDLVPVPAGKYYSGDESHDNAFPTRTIELSAFKIDRYEVSNAWFERYIQGVGDFAQGGTGLRAGTYDANEGTPAPELPRAFVSWPEALAYCEWMGKTLPTVAQAEKAARGGIFLDGDLSAKKENQIPRRRYPTGDTWIGTNNERLLAVAVKRPQDETSAPVPAMFSQVNSDQYPQSEYGVFHLVGNASEWRADSGPKVGWKQNESRVDPLLVSPGSLWRLMEPSSVWTTNEELTRLSVWDELDMDNRRRNLGFRCSTREAGTAGVYKETYNN